jgi:hypothetical protein
MYNEFLRKKSNSYDVITLGDEIVILKKLWKYKLIFTFNKS